MNYLEKLNYLSCKVGNKQINEQITAINQTIQALEKGQIPNERLPQLGLEPDFLAELQGTFPTNEIDFATINELLNNMRNFLAQSFGIWSLPNVQTAQLIADAFALKKGLELMAGNALWSAAFEQAGVTMIATDDYSWSKTSDTGAKTFHPVQQATSAQALAEFGPLVDFVILSWAPNFGTADYDLLMQYRNLVHKPLLLVVGEPNGATNTERFWQNAIRTSLTAEINRSFKSFDFINEKIMKVE